MHIPHAMKPMLRYVKCWYPESVLQKIPHVTDITNTGFLEHTINTGSSVLCHCVQCVSDAVLVCINAKLVAIDPNKHLYFVFTVSLVCLIHKYTQMFVFCI